MLHSANDRQLHQIAELYPMTDEKTKEKIYRKIQERRKYPEKIQVQEKIMQTKTSFGWRHYAGMAAAFLLLIGITASSVLMLNRMKTNPPEELLVTETVHPGADVSAEIPETIPETETAPEELTKELLYSRSASTIRNLHRFFGHIEIRTCNISFILAGNVELDFDANAFHGLVWQSDPETGQQITVLERYVSDQRLAEFLEYTEYDCLYPDGSTEHTEAHKCSYVEYHYAPSNDPTGLHELGTCFCPQEITAGYLSDLNSWDITGIENYQGRECAVLEGTTGSYGARWNVTHWKIIMDIETGVWLFYEGYAEDETVQDYMYTSDIKFDHPDMAVPLITEEEIDSKIAEGYELPENQSAQREYFRNQEEAIPETEEAVLFYEEPDTLPEPFAPGTYHDSYYTPCVERFNKIPEELLNLLTDEQRESWNASGYTLSDIKSELEYANIYTFIRTFGLSKEEVLNALQEYIPGQNPDYCFREDEIEAICSQNIAGTLNNFANPETIVIGSRAYTPCWMYQHTAEDYQNAGITPEMIEIRLPYYHNYNFTPEAEAVFFSRLNYYINHY